MKSSLIRAIIVALAAALLLCACQSGEPTEENEIYRITREQLEMLYASDNYKSLYGVYEQYADIFADRMDIHVTILDDERAAIVLPKPRASVNYVDFEEEGRIGRYYWEDSTLHIVCKPGAFWSYWEVLYVGEAHKAAFENDYRSYSDDEYVISDVDQTDVYSYCVVTGATPLDKNDSNDYLEFFVECDTECRTIKSVKWFEYRANDDGTLIGETGGYDENMKYFSDRGTYDADGNKLS